MLYSPLEQFEIIKMVPFIIRGFDLSITNSSMFLFIILLIFFLVVNVSSSKYTYIPSGIQIILSEFYMLIINIVEDNVGENAFRYFSFVFTLFLFILTANLVGMIPYSFTVTSHLIVTLTLSSAVFFGVTILGLYLHNIKFLGMFLPSGSPMMLVPLLVGIEIISYFARLLSLAIRLFANMLSGHSLLKILAGFAWTMISAGGIFYVLQILPVIVVILITGLELGVAFLQAYVFTVLACVYLNESINLH